MTLEDSPVCNQFVLEIGTIYFLLIVVFVLIIVSNITEHTCLSGIVAHCIKKKRFLFLLNEILAMLFQICMDNHVFNKIKCHNSA